MQLRISILIIFCVFYSCDDINRSEKESQAIKEAIKNREIKKVSDVDILNKARTSGAEIVQLSENEWTQKSKLNQNPELDSLGDIFNALITFIPLNSLDSGLMMTKLEKELLEAYEYSYNNSIELKESIQIEEDRKFVLYTKPLFRSNNKTSADLPDSLVGMWSIRMPVKNIVANL